MNPTIRIVDKLRPMIVVGAVGLHAIAVASVPDYVAQVSQIFDESAFVEVEAVAPEPESLPAPEPEPRRNVARAPAPEAEPERVVENVPQPVPVAETVPVPVAETPTPPSAENTAAAPSDPLTGTGGSVTVATSGNVGSSNGTGTDPSGTSNAVVGPPAVDRRALMRSYRVSASSAIGRLPPLRGTREQIDTTVVVGMHIASDGRLSDVHVVRTSGHPVVDQHVVDFIRGLRRLPPPPPELEFDGREFTYLVRVGA